MKSIFNIIMVLFAAGSSYGDELPQITRYSKTTLSVFQGDTLKLEVGANQPKDLDSNLTFKWGVFGRKSNSKDSDETILCRSASCEINTGDWSVGIHKILMIVYNNAGSQSLLYTLNVLSSPPARNGEVITPTLIRVLEGENDPEVSSIKSNDLVATMRKGRGMIYEGESIQVLGDIERRLEGGESLRTQSRSWMHILQPGNEEHFMGPTTQAGIELTPAKQLIVNVQKGLLRSRNLLSSRAKPKWKVLLNKHVRVEGMTPRSDVVVQVKKIAGDKIYSIAVINDEVRVTWAFEEEEMRQELILSRGQSFQIKESEIEYVKKDEVEVIYHPRKLFGNIFDAVWNNTTPTTDPMPKNRSVLYAKALEFYEMGMFKHSTKYLKNIAPTNDDSKDDIYAKALYLRGRIAIYDEKWMLADKYLTEMLALTENEPDTILQERYYYSALAAYHVEDLKRSKKLFTYTTWKDENDILTNSAYSYLRKLDFSSWFEGHLFAGTFYDGNVFHVKDFDDNIQDSTGLVNKGHGIYTGGGLRVFGFRSKGGALSFGYDAYRKDYLVSGLTKVAYLDQTFDMTILYQMGINEKQDEGIAATFKPWIELQSLGGERVLDTTAYQLQLYLPGLRKFEISFTNLFNLDPLPAREDYLDVTTNEYTSASDKSNEIRLYQAKINLFESSRAIPGFLLDLKFAQTTTSYRYDAASIGDYKKQSVSLPMVQKMNLRNTFHYNLGLEKRTFVNSLDSRSDQVIFVKTKWLRDWTPRFNHNLGLTYETQKSTREGYTFNRPYLEFGFDYHL